MHVRSPSHRQLFVLSIAALFAACSDDNKGKDTAVEDADAGDTVILPDTIRTEVEDTVEDTAFPETIAPGEFGSPCNTNADCNSGYCVDGPKGYVCTRTCDTTCPSGYDCKAVSGGTDVVFLCLPRLKENCAPCAQNFQCQGGICMQIDGQGRCEYRCDANDECPDGFDCAESDQAPGKFCLPATGSCSCYKGADGGLRSCTVPSDLGECVGTQECAPATGWGACSAHEPSPEVCDGQDNDCDGVWDDHLEGAGGPCKNTIAGVGECAGVQICLGASGWLCVGPTPAKEVCNGIDDDCDGKADEDFKTAAGIYGTVDNCGGCGVSCVGAIPNGTALCSTAGVTPRCEVDKCANGYYKAGPTTCLPIEDNSCLPCLQDSHCTTPGDLCLSLDGGDFCGRDCAAGNAHNTPAGQCPAGYVCDDLSDTEGPGVRQCVPVSGSCSCLPQNDGDERPCTNVAAGGTCFGSETCNPTLGWSECSAKSPLPETCNGLDDNCNAVVDDVPGRFDACTTTNTNGSCPGQLDCRPGTAALTCLGPTPGAEVCNGRDDNCDGQTDNVNAPLCPLQKGVCAASHQICAGILGLLACNIGSYGTNYEVKETKCDGLDNDCNGKTDDVDIDGDGHKPIACGGDDCDDTDRLSHPGAEEICGDGADNDCDGTPDNRDFDGDGFIAVQCGGDDCDDNHDTANPSRVETCGDAIDNDCDGSVDNKDIDLDGFVDKRCGGTDCDDDRIDIHPGANEICDGADNNCNGRTDEKDTDNDGFIDKACGGTDCDDTRGTVFPGGTEVCGNTIDEDCSGKLDDRDLDHDGQYDQACAGASDCDDADPMTKPGNAEIWDAKDNDCDGDIDEGVVDVGAIIVTEVMFDPGTPPDALSEWFEITNVSSNAVNLRKWTFWDCGQQASTCTAYDPASSESILVGGSLVIAPGKSLVFCELDDPLNGGVPCDFEYGAAMSLANANDEIVVSQGILSSGTAREISRTSWTGAGNTEGGSRALRTNHYKGSDTNVVANWCSTSQTAAFKIGSSSNYGTPGQYNPGDCIASPPPGVGLVIPNNGIAAGGETVALYGRGFVQGSTTVDIGGSACTQVTVAAGGFQLICKTSTHAAGAASATVNVTGAPPGVALANAYTYTTIGDGPYTAATLVGAANYTVPALSYGPLIVASVAPGGLGGTRAQLGFGPAGSSPGLVGDWRWFDAVRITPGASDIYNRALIIPAAGSYSYAYRFSADGMTWKYTAHFAATVTP